MIGKRPEGSETVEVEDTVIDRWSSRKLEAKQEAPSPDAQPLEPITDDDYPTDADMPPIESLGEDSDYGPFLSPKVSEQLRQLALRRLFRTPSFSLRDGLDDYDDDFTSFVPLGEIITADLRHRLEVEARRRAEAMLENDVPETGDEGPIVAPADSPLADATDTVVEPVAPAKADETDEQI